MVEHYRDCLNGAAWPSSECQNAPLSHLYFSVPRVFCNNLNLWTCSGATPAFQSSIIFSHIPLRSWSSKVHDSLKWYTCGPCSSYILCSQNGFQWVTLFTIWPRARLAQPEVQSKSFWPGTSIMDALKHLMFVEKNSEGIWMVVIRFTHLSKYKTCLKAITEKKKKKRKKVCVAIL